MLSWDTIQSQFMPLGSIGQEKTEPTVKKEELESVSHF